MKSFIAFLLGLVIQLSQAPSCMADLPLMPCATSARPMGCCEGLKSCPCAKENDRNQKPAPLLPASADLKLLLSKAPETIRLTTLFSLPADALLATPSALENRGVYAGVPLSVAFCSFVI